MLITTTEELNMYLPNNLLPDLNMLGGFIEQAENSFIMPVLGKPLFDKLNTEYKAIEDKSVLLPDSTTEQTGWMKLIKAVQCATLFYALYDGAEFLNITITQSGMMQVSTDGMSPTSDNNIAGFKKSARTKAYQAKDLLYILLEEDAAAAVPQYVTLWKESRFYSIIKGRLITTASQFQRFIDIYESREKFVSLIPDISYCESMYIRGELGTDFVTALIEQQTAGKLTGIKQDVVDKLQTALALFVEDRSKLFSRPEAKNEAVMMLNIAKRDIQDHQSAFIPEIQTSPLYVAPNTEPPASKEWVNNKSGDQLFVLSRP